MTLPNSSERCDLVLDVAPDNAYDEQQLVETKKNTKTYNKTAEK
jgi:hypothetical protein